MIELYLNIKAFIGIASLVVIVGILFLFATVHIVHIVEKIREGKRK